MDSPLPPFHFCEKPSESTKSQDGAQENRRGNISLPIRGPIELREARGRRRIWKLEDFEVNPALLVMFLWNHCPYVQCLREEIVKLANCYMEKGLGVMAISSNSVTSHPQDGPEFLAEEASLYDYPFPYLFDESQGLARDLSAVCTPEFFLFKKDDKEALFVLVYHGQFDDSRPYNDFPVTGRDLRTAIDCVLNGLSVPSDQKPCVGCSIKWHPETAVE